MPIKKLLIVLLLIVCHYLDSCWHSWENIKKNQVNFTDDLSGFQNMLLGGDEINDRFDDTDSYEDDFS